MFWELLKIEDFQIFGHMLIWDGQFYFISVQFMYFILGWPTLVLGPSIECCVHMTQPFVNLQGFSQLANIIHAEVLQFQAEVINCL